MDNILDDIKIMLGLTSDYDVFDSQIKIHINGVFSTLQQLGVGPSPQFRIRDASETWDEFFAQTAEPENLEFVKDYIYNKVRLVFDPPANSFGIAAIEKQIEELTWRINVQGDSTSNARS